jgi:carboxypeptidase Q
MFLAAAAAAESPSQSDARAAPASQEPKPINAALPERYADVAQRILDAVRAGNDGYRKLERLCDDIGHRLSGSPGLERAIDWAVATLKADGHENVRTQPVDVVRWVRGEESLEMIEPRRMRLSMLGLGGSVATPPEGITAPVISVSGQDELNELREKVRGKIVLFDVPMSSTSPERGSGYGTAARYRGYGARWASEFGAVAALTRSATTRSLRSPHTGAMNYFDAKNRIPAAALATEDAAMISRMLKSGAEVKVTLKMQARSDEQLARSANVIAELRGSEQPDEVVLIGGHLDSWDVGQGAHDDGGGCVQSMEALNVLRKLGLRPRRTIRVVLFTNEENGLAGGRAYAKEHAAELPRHVAAIETDSGTFTPRGFGVSVEGKQDAAIAQLGEIVKLLAPLGADSASGGGGGADISPMGPAGVPLLGLRVDQTHYFDYHHTHADTLDKIDPKHLDQCVAAMAIVAYVLADMPGRLGSP